jgi:NDP-4-keto-2,6-dideoxyhexose 3-C-methyltransferase
MKTNSLLIHEHLECRLCGSSDMTEVLDIGSQYVNNFVEKHNWSGIYCPLVIDHCNNCDLYQLRHTAPQELLYKGTYWYKSGVTDFMVSHLRELAGEISLSVQHIDNPSVLDIGANDGTFLKYIAPTSKRVAVEPAKNLQAELNDNCDVVYSDLWTSDFAQDIVDKEGTFDVITALGMFYDLDDPSDFVSGVSRALKDDGVFIAQLMCMSNMLATNDLGNVCHEHIEFYTLKSLEYLFQKSGLIIYEVTTNNVNGQSYRIKARKALAASSTTPSHIKDMIRNETSDLGAFNSSIHYSKQKVREFIHSQNKLGKTTAAFGASTKGNSILQFFNLSYKDIPFAVDRSPGKTGLYTIGSWIPILHEDDPERFKADYYLVLPWGFINEFLNRESQFLDNGGVFIVPFPRPHLISRQGVVDL